MNAGSLNFTLGLQANQFLNSLGIASGKLLGFLGVANGIQLAFGKMWESIEKGGQLKDLAASASLAVKDLYQLQRAFKEVGASADSVPAVIRRLRRTLGGGEQNGLLAGIGLDPAALGKMNPARQFEAVAQALGKLNVNARSQAAAKIFGREGAATIEQIANSGQDFADAMAAAASDAKIWERVATTFDDIGDKVSRIFAKIETMWALITGALVAAFKDGTLLQTIFDIFSTVFQTLGDALPNLLMSGLVKLGATLLQVFKYPVAWLQTALDLAVQGLFVTLSTIASPAGAELLGIPKNFRAENWKDILNRNLNSPSFANGIGFGDMDKFASDQLSSGLNAGQARVRELVNALLGKITGLPAGTIANNFAGGLGIAAAKITPSSEVTNIEKMGAVLGGLGRGFGGDEARRTADNTKRSADSLQRIENKLGAGTTNFDNLD